MKMLYKNAYFLQMAFLQDLFPPLKYVKCTCMRLNIYANTKVVAVYVVLE